MGRLRRSCCLGAPDQSRFVGLKSFSGKGADENRPTGGVHDLDLVRLTVTPQEVNYCPPHSTRKAFVGQVPSQVHCLKQLEQETYRGKAVVRRGVTEPRSKIQPVRTTPLPLGPVTGMSTVNREPYWSTFPGTGVWSMTPLRI